MIIYFLNDCLFDKDISLYKKLPEVGYRLASSVGGKAARLPEGRFRRAKKNRQVTYIAPLNRIPLLSSDPGGVLQELAV